MLVAASLTWVWLLQSMSASNFPQASAEPENIRTEDAPSAFKNQLVPPGGGGREHAALAPHDHGDQHHYISAMGLRSRGPRRRETSGTTSSGTTAARTTSTTSKVKVLSNHPRRRLRSRKAADGSINTRSFSVSLRDVRDVQLQTYVGIGTPPQRFTVVVDTGSSDTWVFAKNISVTSSSSTSGGRGSEVDALAIAPHTFDITKSSTARELRAVINAGPLQEHAPGLLGAAGRGPEHENSSPQHHIHFRYGDGTRASAFAFEDAVELLLPDEGFEGGDDEKSLKIPRQFLLATDRLTNAGGPGHAMHADGVLGLAHYFEDVTGKRPAGAKTFIRTLFETYPDLEKEFWLFLQSAQNLSSDEDHDNDADHLRSSTSTSRLVFGRPHQVDQLTSSMRYGRRYYMDRTDLWITSIWSLGFVDSPHRRENRNPHQSSSSHSSYTFAGGGAFGAPALIDSGSSFLVVTTALFDFLFDPTATASDSEYQPQLPAALLSCEPYPGRADSLRICDCPASQAEKEKLPALSANFLDSEERVFSLCLTPEEYLILGRDQMIQVPHPVTGELKCVPAIERGSDAQPVPVILGLAMLRPYVTKFDLEEHRIGFARVRDVEKAERWCGAGWNLQSGEEVGVLGGVFPPWFSSFSVLNRWPQVACLLCGALCGALVFVVVRKLLHGRAASRETTNSGGGSPLLLE